MGLCRSVAEEHRVVASEILVKRARGEWGLEADRDAVISERLLWAQMTEAEQDAENAWLAGIWVGRGVVRHLADRDGAMVVIPDSAFGLASDGYRPWVKGPWAEGAIWKWLWLRGYQVIQHIPSRGPGLGRSRSTMVVPSHRLVQESERLVAAMVKAGSSIGPWGSEAAVQVRSSYDPVQGLGTMELIGVEHLAALV
jgi:hypothetical protein